MLNKDEELTVLEGAEPFFDEEEVFEIKEELFDIHEEENELDKENETLYDENEVAFLRETLFGEEESEFDSENDSELSSDFESEEEDDFDEDDYSEDFASYEDDMDVEFENEDLTKEKHEMNPQKGKNKFLLAVREFFSFLLYIGFAMIFTYLIIHFVGQRTVVNGPSMMHTLHNGDNIILDKISYRFHDPERYDVVVFPVENEERDYIKRIIGMPGETIQIINGFVYVKDENGEMKELGECYGSEIMADGQYDYLTTAPVTLGEDEYFVLGDNRNDSIDSRRIGPIKRDTIEGRAWIRIYPFDSIGKIK